jgi:hypothetical protein
MIQQHTSNQPQKTPHWWNDRTLFLYHFVRSNYVTAVWNWFMGLAGKAAEPFLFASVLYSGYKLLPGVPQPGVGFDAFMFIAQQATLDIGGMGLMKLAQQAKQEKHSFAYRVGFILVGLMIANVVMASLERLVAFSPDAVTGVEGTLLIARAVMAVLYGHAIHSLRQGEVEPTHVVKSTDIHASLQEFNQTLQHLQQKTERQLQHIESHLESVVHAKAAALDESMRHFTGQYTESLSTVETGLQEYIDERLAPIVVTLEGHAEGLSLLTTLMPTLTEEVTRVVKVTLEQHTQITRQEASVLAEMALKQEKPTQLKRSRSIVESNGKTGRAPALIIEAEFDKKRFVYVCLQEDPSMTIAAIQERATRMNQTISIGCVSGHRKAFFESVKAPEMKAVASLSAPESEKASTEIETVLAIS